MKLTSHNVIHKHWYVYFWLFTADVLAPPGPWHCIKLASMWTMALDPLHKNFMSLWLKSRKSFGFNFYYINPIRSWICKCHDSWNVVTCAKFVTWSGIFFHVRIFTRFPLWAYKPLVKCAPGWSHTANPGTPMKWKTLPILTDILWHLIIFSLTFSSILPHPYSYTLCLYISVNNTVFVPYDCTWGSRHVWWGIVQASLDRRWEKWQTRHMCDIKGFPGINKTRGPL